MSRGGKGDAAVWEEFSGRPDELHRLARAIRTGHLSPAAKPEAVAHEDDDEAAFPEGRIVYRLHRARERSRPLVEKKKAQVLTLTGRLTCEACDFDFGQTYGAVGEGYIECHHANPLSELTEPTATQLKDLVLVCSNCHRMIHRKRPWPDVDAIRELARPNSAEGDQVRAVEERRQPDDESGVRPERGGGTGTTVSVDPAYKDYRDIGVVVLAKEASRIKASVVSLASRGLTGQPSVEAMADTLVAIASEVAADWIFIDGPQGWKDPNNGLEHARCCEQKLATPGKTGLPGSTKPSTYLGFTAFAIELFDALDARGWPRLASQSVPPATTRCAIESFPTSAWSGLGLTPLPAKAKTRQETLRENLDALRTIYPLDVADELTHDQLQALVAGLAGLGLSDGEAAGIAISGVPPVLVDGSWREGFIVNPRRTSSMMR
jgi:hypothetical protein